MAVEIANIEKRYFKLLLTTSSKVKQQNRNFAKDFAKMQKLN